MKKQHWSTETISLLIFAIVLFSLITLFGNIFMRSTAEWGHESNKVTDSHNLYPDTIENVYIVNNLNAPNKDLAQYSYLVPFNMTNNYDQEETYTMSVSLLNSYLVHSFAPRGEVELKTSHKRYRKTTREHREVPVVSHLAGLGQIPDSRTQFYFRNRKTCTYYNPTFTQTCNEWNFTANLEPGQTSDTFYLDFPIAHWDESYINAEGSTFELRIVREKGYYPIEIQHIVDCRDARAESEECSSLQK